MEHSSDPDTCVEGDRTRHYGTLSFFLLSSPESFSNRLYRSGCFGCKQQQSNLGKAPRSQTHWEIVEREQTGRLRGLGDRTPRVGVGWAGPYSRNRVSERTPETKELQVRVQAVRLPMNAQARHPPQSQPRGSSPHRWSPGQTQRQSCLLRGYQEFHDGDCSAWSRRQAYS